MGERQSGWADEKPKSNMVRKSSKFSHQDSKDVAEAVPISVEGSLTRDQNLKRENFNRAAALKELNANSSSKLFLEGVDLRPFTKNLVPESQLQEPDIPWNWDVLFAEMVPDLTETLEDNV